MLRHCFWMVVMGMLVGGVAYAEDAKEKDKAHADHADRSMDKGDMAAPQARFPTGIAAREADDLEDIKDVIGTATQAAMTKDGFNDLVERLNDQDRNRIGEGDDALNYEQLNGRIAQLQKAWQDKYGQDFAVDHRTALAKVAVIQGEVQDPRLAIAGWPVPATAKQSRERPDVGAVPAAETERATPMVETPVEAANLEEGREVAIATFPTYHKMPGMNVSLVGEVQAWRIDIPNHVTAKKLYDNLLTHLTYLGEHTDMWPADAQQASAAFTHHVMMALYDVPMMHGDAKAAPKARQGD